MQPPVQARTHAVASFNDTTGPRRWMVPLQMADTTFEVGEMRLAFLVVTEHASSVDNLEPLTSSDGFIECKVKLRVDLLGYVNHGNHGARLPRRQIRTRNHHDRRRRYHRHGLGDFQPARPRDPRQLVSAQHHNPCAARFGGKRLDNVASQHDCCHGNIGGQISGQVPESFEQGSRCREVGGDMYRTKT